MEPIFQSGEAFVFLREEPQLLRYRPILGQGVRLRSKAEASHPDNEWLTEGVDFVVDYTQGTIRRVDHGKIPDWSLHPLCGKLSFDHRQYTAISNAPYTFYANYSYAPRQDESADDCYSPSKGLSRLRRKLKAGGLVTYVVFGDSISMGAEVPDERHRFAFRFARQLEERYLDVEVDVRMKAVGGETSSRALTRLYEDVILQKPDIITIGYGMNDQNRSEGGGNSVPQAVYERNIETMIEQIRDNTEADIILLTSCLPNPAWMFASANAADYAEILRRMAVKHDTALADVQRIWITELTAGKSQASLLINHINHPNEYGHGLYARTLVSLV